MGLLTSSLITLVAMFAAPEVMSKNCGMSLCSAYCDVQSSGS